MTSLSSAQPVERHPIVGVTAPKCRHDSASTKGPGAGCFRSRCHALDEQRGRAAQPGAAPWRRVPVTASARSLGAHWLVRLLGDDALAFVGLDLEVDLGSMNWNVRRSLNAQAHLCALAREHPDLDVVANHDALVRGRKGAP